MTNKQSPIQYKFLKSFLKYFSAALITVLVDYCITALCIYFGIVYYISLSVGVLIGGVIGFLLLSLWVFPNKNDSCSPKRILGYSAGVLFVYIVRTLVMMVCAHFVEIESTQDIKQYLFLILSYGISFIANFLFQKYFVFTEKYKN